MKHWNKKILVPLLAGLALGTGGYAQTKATATTITGQVQGQVEGKKVYLRYADTTHQLIDSTVIHNNRFVLHWRTASPRFLTLVFKEPEVTNRGMQDKVLQLFAEAKPVTITAVYDSLKREYETYGNKLVLQATVTGSAAHTQYLGYYQQVATYDAARSDFFQQYVAYLNPGKGMARGPQATGIAITKQMDSVDALKKAYILRYIGSQQPGELLAFIAKDAANMSITTTTEIDKLLQQFAGMKGSGPLLTDFRAAATLARKTAVGSSLYNFTLTDMNGQGQQLSQYIGKGNYVLLEFWASWCHPCRADIPHLKEAYGVYHDAGFDIVSVSLDNDKAKWLKAVGEEDLASRWTQLADLDAFNGGLAKTYRINAIPSCLLFDPNGKLVTRNFRGSWMDGGLVAMYGNRFPTHTAGSNTFTIDGTVKGNMPGYIYLSYNNGKNVRDSSLVKDGHFRFTGTLSGTTRGNLNSGAQIYNARSYASLFLEPGSLQVTLAADNFNDMTISGSPLQTVYMQLLQARAPYMQQLIALNASYDAANNRYMAAKRAGATEKELEALKEAANEEKEKGTPVRYQLQQEELKFFAAHPGSYITASHLRSYVSSMSADTLQAYYNRLSPDVQRSDAGEELALEIAQLKKGSPGSTAAAFTAEDITGKPLSLSDFKGKYVLVDFWASWCVPCRKGNPHLKELYAKYKNKGFEIIGVSDDDRNETAWKQAVEKDGIGIWKHIRRGFDMELMNKLGPGKPQPNDISNRYGIHSLPTQVLIDGNGVIIGRYGGGGEAHEKLDSKLRELFGS